MSTKTAGPRAAEAILYEALNSRAALKIAASQVVLAGMLLGMIATSDAGGGAQTVAAAVAYAGNTGGSGAVGALTADAHAPAGRYQLICIEPGTNAGKFVVYKPDGTVDGIATGAVAYNGTLNFTISDATDFVSGDGFYVDVSYADAAHAKEFKAWDPDATAGSQNPVAVAVYPVTTGAGENADLVAIVWNADMNFNLIQWHDGADDNDKSAARASLMAGATIYDTKGNPLTAGRINLRA